MQRQAGWSGAGKFVEGDLDTEGGSSREPQVVAGNIFQRVVDGHAIRQRRGVVVVVGRCRPLGGHHVASRQAEARNHCDKTEDEILVHLQKFWLTNKYKDTKLFSICNESFLVRLRKSVVQIANRFFRLVRVALELRFYQSTRMQHDDKTYRVGIAQ